MITKRFVSLVWYRVRIIPLSVVVLDVRIWRSILKAVHLYLVHTPIEVVGIVLYCHDFYFTGWIRVWVLRMCV